MKEQALPSVSAASATIIPDAPEMARWMKPYFIASGPSIIPSFIRENSLPKSESAVIV
jgi:hypothetical protein